MPVAAYARWNAKLAGFTLTHESVAAMAAERQRPDELRACMQTLTSPEAVVAYSRAATRERGDYTETEQHKTTRLWSAPPVLVLVLKRFKVSRPRRSRVGRG